jgi:hypothetical protein
VTCASAYLTRPALRAFSPTPPGLSRHRPFHKDVRFPSYSHVVHWPRAYMMVS